jgi:hypothetical protein
MKVQTGSRQIFSAFQYDFAIDGGAVGAIATGLWLPAKSIVMGFVIAVNTTFTSGGSATVQVQSVANTINLTGAMTVNSLVSGVVQQNNNIVTLSSITTGAGTGNSNNWFLTNSDQLSIVIATAAITGGKLSGYIVYAVSPF